RAIRRRARSGLRTGAGSAALVGRATRSSARASARGGPSSAAPRGPRWWSPTAAPCGRWPTSSSAMPRRARPSAGAPSRGSTPRAARSRAGAGEHPRPRRREDEMRLLVALDLRESPERVVAEAARWAERLDAVVDLVFVDEFYSSAAYIDEPNLRRMVVDEWE